ncbi:MAG: SRPBCC family protein [Gemmatimonadota bacterium]
MGEVREVLRVVEEVVVEAPIERVFRALSSPGEVPLWWRAEGQYETTAAEIDLRPGGRYRLSGTSERLGTFEVGGTYLVVDPPTRLVFTWRPDWDEDARNSKVEIHLEEVSAGTRVRVTHTGFATTDARDGHAGGWPNVLHRLSIHVEA